MELRYCEECGDVIRVDNESPLSLSDHFICEKCQSGIRAPATPAETDPGQQEEALEKKELNLFSNETIAMRKVQYQQKQSKAEDQEKPKSTHLRLVRSDAGPDAPPEAGSSGEAGTKRKQKILFRCIHCRATLSIRPVDKNSKLTCPHCSQTIYVTPGGKLCKTPPPNTMKRGAGLLMEKKAGSTLQYLGTTPPSGEGSSANLASKSGRVVKRVVGNKGVPNPESSRVVPRKVRGSQAVRKAPGSQAVRQPGSARMTTGSARLTTGSARLTTGSARLTTGSSRRIAAGPAPSAGTAPQESPVSAFDEHSISENPAKTAFLSQEPSSSLNALTSQNPLVEHGPQHAGLTEETNPEALLPDESDLLDDGDDFASLAAQSFEAAPRKSQTGKPEMACRKGGGLLKGTIQTLFLVVCLCGPLVLTSLFAPPRAFALSLSKGEVSPPPFIERVQKTCTRGVYRLLGE